MPPVSHRAAAPIASRPLQCHAHSMVWWFLLALGAAALGHGHPVPSALFFAGGLLACYLVSLLLHPRRVLPFLRRDGQAPGSDVLVGRPGVHHVRGRFPSSPLGRPGAPRRVREADVG